MYEKSLAPSMGAVAGPIAETMPYQPTVTENLENRKKNLEKQLERVNAALEALKRNPQVEEVMNLIQRAAY